MTKLDDLFINVADEMRFAKLVAWDGCHKIYLAMDYNQMDWFQQNYEHFLASTPEVMFETLKKWYDDSCPLKFISAVETNEADPNEGFTHLIPQCAEDEARREEEEEEYAY